MSVCRPRPRGALSASFALPALAMTLVGSVLTADAVAAAPASATPGVTSSVRGALEMTSSTEWYASGQFVLRNTGSTAAPWRLTFDLSSGEFQNWAGWMSDTEQHGRSVTVSSKEGEPLAAGATTALSFGVSGDGSVVPAIGSCDLDGAEVAGCSGVDPVDPVDPVDDVTAPGVVPGFAGEARDSRTIDLRWDAADDDRGVDGYAITRDGAEPIRVGADARTARVSELTPGATFGFSIAAVDAAGNVGEGVTTEVATPAEAVPAPQLVVEASHSVAPVRPLGDPERSRADEGRRLRHLAHESTGRFVTAGQPVTVTVPEGVSGLVARVGLYGTYSGLNGGRDVAQHETALRPGVNVVTSTVSGVLALRDTAAEGSRTTTVRVDGGRPMVTFVEGQTTRDELADRMRRFDAPIVELVGRRVVVQVQRATAQQTLLAGGNDIGAQVRALDDAVDGTDALFGLDRAGSGSTRRSDQRVLVTNPDSGSGYASATHDRLTFQNASGAMRTLLTGDPDDKWSFYHELGHTYQPDWMNWDGNVEVTVNVPALANQERLNGGSYNRLDDAGKRAMASAFFAKPQSARTFDDQDIWVRLLMFDQLRRAFGDDFCARMAMQFRVDRALGQAVPGASENTVRRQQFVLTASRVADRDLTAFFDDWGFGLTVQTRSAMAGRPAPAFDLTSNRHRPGDRIESLVSRNDPVGTARVSGAATYGQRSLGDSLVTSVDTAEGTQVGRTSVTATALGSRAGRVAVEFVSDDGTPSVMQLPIDVTRGSMVEFKGLGDRSIAVIALDPASGRISLERTGGSAKAHDKFTTRYFGATLIDTNGTVLRDGYLRGVETAGAFASRFDGTPYADGQFIVLDHREPGNRLLRWSDGQALDRNTRQQQAYRIDGTALVPVALTDVPGR